MLPETGQPIFDLATDEMVGTVTEVDDVCFGMKRLPGKKITAAYLVLANGERFTIPAGPPPWFSEPFHRPKPED